MSKLKIAAQTIKDVVIHAKKTGQLKASEKVIEFRKEVCEKCPFFDGTRCESCGCFMDIKTKLAAAVCPENYWAQKEVELELFGIIDDVYIKQKCCGV